MSDGRQHPAHPPVRERHNQPIVVFLTVCSSNRKRIFASKDVVEAVINAWTGAISWLVGRYIFMPDHIHMFCAPATCPAESLKQWVRYWKNIASRNWPAGRRTSNLAA
jgi:putative transposase